MHNRPSLKFRSRAAHCLTLLLWMLPLAAFSETIVLHLRNGDRLSGTLISESTESVVIKTPWSKELAVPASEIARREKPANAPSTNVVAVAATPAVSTNKPAPKISRQRSWHGKIDLGIDLGFGEKNRELYYGKAKVAYAPEVPPDQPRTLASRFKNTFDYQVTYGRTEGIVSANRMDGSSKTDFEISKKFFVYNLVGAGYDEIRKIDYQYEVGPGVGYRLVQRTNLFLNTEFGLDYQLQSYTGNKDNERFFFRIAEDGGWTITKKLSLDEKLEMFPSLDEFRSFRLRFESNLRYALWQNISLTLSVLDLFDTKPAPGVPKNDLQVRSLIGITF